jgi:hypothetical protein
LTKGLGNLVSGYQKLSLRFTKWAEMVYLLFWFAGTANDKMHSRYSFNTAESME